MNRTQAELGILYAALTYGPSAVETIINTAGDQSAFLFTTPERRKIWRVISDLYANSKTPDAFLVAAALDTDDDSQNELQQINLAFCGRSQIELYVDALLADSIRAEGQNIGLKMSTGRMSVEEAVEELQNLVGRSGDESMRDLDTMAADFMGQVELSREGKLERVVTGFKELDDLIGGMEPGNLTILAGRPGMGKTALAVNIALKQSKPTMFFSLEMSSRELYERCLSYYGIPGDRLRQHDSWSNEEWASLTRSMKRLAEEHKLIVCDKGAISIAELETKVFQATRANDVSLVLIDYLQLIRCRSESRLQEVSEISRRLKALAKNAGVTILALAQLNRQMEHRANPIPLLSDLRESGQIEQDADQIFFVHRPEMVDAADRPGVAEVHLKKNRHGRTGVVGLDFNGALMRFKSMQGESWLKVAGTKENAASSSGVPF